MAMVSFLSHCGLENDSIATGASMSEFILVVILSGADIRESEGIGLRLRKTITLRERAGFAK